MLNSVQPLFNLMQCVLSSDQQRVCIIILVSEVIIMVLQVVVLAVGSISQAISTPLILLHNIHGRRQSHPRMIQVHTKRNEQYRSISAYKWLESNGSATVAAQTERMSIRELNQMRASEASMEDLMATYSSRAVVWQCE